MQRRLAVVSALAAVVLGTMPTSTSATSGGTDAQGCHTDRKGGTGYPCHNGSKSKKAPPRASARAVGLVSGGSRQGAYADCTTARAAGAVNIRRGEPGYGAHLDRDGDGVGCER